MSLLTYKNFYGTTETTVSGNSTHYHGKVLLMKDLVTYGVDVKEWLQKAFEKAVDDYLLTCDEVGKVPDVSHSTTKQPT